MILSMHEAFYIEALTFNVDAVLFCVQNLNSELENIESANIQIKTHTILNILQDMIVHTANISKFFFPSDKKPLYRDRGIQLREIYDITENNPVCNRTVRNTIEHFDEHLDKFLFDFPTGTIYPEYLGTKSKVTCPTYKFLRAYFIDIEEFQILHASIKIRPLTEAVHRIREKIDSQISNGMHF